MSRYAILARLVLLAAALPASADTIIHGRLLGAGDAPLAAAHVHLQRGSFRSRGESPSQLQQVAVDERGGFRLSTDATGYVELYFSGVNHISGYLALFLGRDPDIEVEVHLPTYTYLDAPSDVKVAIAGGSTPEVHPMTPVGEGRFRYEGPSAAAEVEYQITGLTKEAYGALAGTSGEGCRYDDRRQYRSVAVSREGRLVIEVDSRRLPRNGAWAYSAKPAFSARIVTVFERAGAHRTEAALAQKNRLGPGQTAPSPLPEDDALFLGLIRRELEGEKDVPVRQALLVSTAVAAATLDRDLAQRALDEIPPDSSFWSYGAGVSVLRALLRTEIWSGSAEELWTTHFRDRTSACSEYLEELLARHPVDNVKTALLQVWLYSAAQRGDDEEMPRLYARLVEGYPDSVEARAARSEYGPEARVRLGKPVPDFRLRLLGDGDRTVTREQLLGKPYIIDFWATWCGPCVQQIPNLSAAYERFHSQGFEILSISFDDRVERVVSFRKEKQPMRWWHHYAEGGFEGNLARAFQVALLPKIFLVDRAGTIVATRVELEGDKLMDTVARVVAEPGPDRARQTPQED